MVEFVSGLVPRFLARNVHLFFFLRIIVLSTCHQEFHIAHAGMYVFDASFSVSIRFCCHFLGYGWMDKRLLMFNCCVLL